MLEDHTMTLYCTPDANSIKRAEEAAEREIEAQSAILSVRRQSLWEIEAEQRRAVFWANVDVNRLIASRAERMGR